MIYRLILISITFIGLFGCATAYERCSKDNQWQRYGSMDQCVSELNERRAEARYNMAHAFDGMGKQKTQECTVNNKYNYGGSYTANCN